jgi:hypothetical protein
MLWFWRLEICKNQWDVCERKEEQEEISLSLAHSLYDFSGAPESSTSRKTALLASMAELALSKINSGGGSPDLAFNNLWTTLQHHLRHAS